VVYGLAKSVIDQENRSERMVVFKSIAELVEKI
jgi:hypothetical protein